MDFLQQAAHLASDSEPESVKRAAAIDPAEETTYLDAEHVVILMQENRSFDHSYGALQGVKGYGDPHPHVLADGRPVWLQTNERGETYAPFRLDIKETNATWMGTLPHCYDNQVDARNGGYYDRWLQAKPSEHEQYAEMPLTMGCHTREDIPFYYALADAFTICDYHFCSSLTGTTPNRLYMWTGTIRAQQSANSKACVYNEDADHTTEVNWTTFPERLEDAGISWRIYQNELSTPSGLTSEEEHWLSNYTDNTIEFFSQYNVGFAHRCRANAQEMFDKLTDREKSIHCKAFTTNEGDPNFRTLEPHVYMDNGVEREVWVPKGDVLHQFRQDVQTGNLPTVSWLVAPEAFSDHPSSAWYGAWYVSEALDILTENPEVWKKTIFILTYDENDGYFDHVPPFTAPHPDKPETGLVSEGIDVSIEYVTLEQELELRPGYPPIESTIGLGFRVPLVIASPWSRGGCVNSQVFDHTSLLQFLEHWLTHKTGQPIKEPNISAWRRTVCGDLTSVFQPYHGEPTPKPPFPPRNEFIQEIHKAKFQNPPSGLDPLTPAQIESIKQDPASSPHKVSQEKGTRTVLPLPYELYADARLNAERTKLEITFTAGNTFLGERSAGSPFNVYAYHSLVGKRMQVRAYAVSAGKSLTDSWSISEFDDNRYHIRVDGPNGFLRELKGGAQDPDLAVKVRYAIKDTGQPSGDMEISIDNKTQSPQPIEIEGRLDPGRPVLEVVPPGSAHLVCLVTQETRYDFTLRLPRHQGYERTFAGRAETGRVVES